MIAPIATVIFAIAMALSLSVEADSFFHTPTTTSAEPANEAEPTVEARDDRAPVP